MHNLIFYITPHLIFHNAIYKIIIIFSTKNSLYKLLDKKSCHFNYKTVTFNCDSLFIELLWIFERGMLFFKPISVEYLSFSGIWKDLKTKREVRVFMEIKKTVNIKEN